MQTRLLTHLLRSGTALALAAAPLVHAGDTHPVMEAARARIAAFHQGQPDNGALLRVVYFHATDQAPLANHRTRVDRIMKDVSRFYREEMAARFSVETPGLPLELRDGSTIIHEVRGQHPATQYNHQSGDAIWNEVKAALTEIIKPDREHVLILHGLCGKEGDLHVFHAPYYGAGWSDHRRGLCHAADCEKLDPELLTATDQTFIFKEHYYERKELSVAEFNTWYLGGIAHELGHGLGFPHDNGSPGEAAGVSLMGGGNLHYREDLWGGKNPAYLALATALRFAAHPMVTRSDKARWQPAAASIDLTDVRSTPGKIRISGRVLSDTPVCALIATAWPTDARTDHGAMTFCSAIREDGSFEVELTHLNKPSWHLKLGALQVNGAETKDRLTLYLDSEAKPDSDRLLADWRKLSAAKSQTVTAKPEPVLMTTTPAPTAIDLSGTWRFAADPQDHGANATREQWRFPDTITLPGHVAAQGFGDKPTFEMKWTGDGWKYPELFKEWQSPENFKMPFFLQPPLRYEGPAWFQRDLEIPATWQGNHAILHLERVHWHSRVWINGKLVGNANSLGCPHEFDLGPLPPGKHELTLRIDNRIREINPGPLSHSVTDHTQGNWNGAVGRIELRPAPAHHITHLRVEPSFSNKSVRLKVETTATTPGKLSARLRYLGPQRDFFETPAVASQLSDGSAEIIIPLGRDPRPWNEFTPHLYQAEVIMETSAGSITRSATFGFRDTGIKNGRLAINGQPLFLRGTLECCIFPLTGHPPTDVDSWRRFIRICKAHGLNHIRFHSYCPPEAAFIAADELGFYYQVEASTWPNQGAEIGSGRPLDQWVEDETARMIHAYGNHPSFLMMASGNEPAGPNHAKWLQQYVARWQKADPRRFWTTAANWTVMPGSDFHNPAEPRIQAWGQGLKSIINAQPPRTDFDWSDYLKLDPGVPVVSHEIGQWCVYPNFDEIKKYTGWFKPKNFEIFQETARRNGLLDQARDLLMASGKLQTLCYKHDIEAALRTPGFGGYQLLDLRDFPGQGTALVGVLDPFWDEKGYVTPEEFASFSGPIVPLAKLPKLTFTTADTLTGEYLLSHFGPVDLTNITPTWSLRHGETIIAQGNLPTRDLPAGELYLLDKLSIPLSEVPAPAKLILSIGAKDQSFSNSWNLFVYPAKPEPVTTDGITLTRSLDETIAALEKGATVLWNPPASEIADDSSRPLVAGFSSIFWNTAWTEWQAPHTLGILCDPKHPALAKFPTDFHSDWQWWEIQKDARPFILTPHHQLKPIVQLIDDWVTNRKLGYVFEARVGTGRLLACSADIITGLDQRPVARQLRSSLLSYLAGTSMPAQTSSLSPADLHKLGIRN